MADNTVKQFRIEIGGVKESIANLETLEDVLGKVEKQVSEINAGGKLGAAYKLANKELEEQIKLERDNITIQQNATNTYKQKQQLLSALGRKIKSMTADETANGRTQKELIDQYKSINQELKDFDAQMGNHQRSVGDYKNQIKEAAMEIKGMEGQLVEMLKNGVDKADPAFVELAKKAGDLQDKINDAREEVKRFASDTKVLDDIIDVAKSATSAFGLYKGAMSVFGVETENAEKAVQKLAGAMSVIQSLKTLQETMKKGSATAKLFNLAMKATGAQLVTNQLASIKATLATEGLSKAEKAATVTTKAFNLALKAIPLMLVITLIVALVSRWKEFVAWIEKTIPGMSNLGKIFKSSLNVLKAFGAAVINWVVNPLKTLIETIVKLISLDFRGAFRALTDGIRNQFRGTAEAFRNAGRESREEWERGWDDAAERQRHNSERRRQYNLETDIANDENELARLRIEERNRNTYSERYINLQKKIYRERRELARNNQSELQKIDLEEMQFDADVQDKITADREEAERERVAAAKAGQEARLKLLEDEIRKQRELIERSREYALEIQNTQIAQAKMQEYTLKQEVEKYQSGPLEKYTEALNKLIEKQNELKMLETGKTFQDTVFALTDEITTINKAAGAWEYFTNKAIEYYQGKVDENAIRQRAELTWGLIVDELTRLEKSEDVIKIANWLGLDDADRAKLLSEWNKLLQLRFQITAEYNQKEAENNKAKLSVIKEELSQFTDDFEREYDKLINHVKDSALETPVRDKIFGFIDKEKTLENLKQLQIVWDKGYIELSSIISKEEARWELYLENVKNIYGQDSNLYKQAINEKIDALNKLKVKLNEVGIRANSPVSTEIDYTGDNKANASTKPQKKLWYDKNDKKQDGSEYSLLENLTNLYTQLGEMVLVPAMDTLSMFMDFAIEQTQQKLEEVEKLHDEALDKVNDSADKIQELNDKLRDSSNTNLEATKQQLADEQLLYAQRLAEEKKLAEEERRLKNKAAEQEAKARKIELAYQMAQGIANTAQGATKAIAEWGWPQGAIFAGLLSALGAVQVALIAKQMAAIKPVKYADGGLIAGNAKYHSQGGARIEGTNLEVERGEFVVNRKSTKKYLPLLDVINAEGNGGKHTLADKKIRKFANGGLTPNFEAIDDNLRATATTNRILDAIDSIDFAPVVAVTDINRVNDRLTRVKSLAGKN